MVPRRAAGGLRRQAAARRGQGSREGRRRPDHHAHALQVERRRVPGRPPCPSLGGRPENRRGAAGHLRGRRRVEPGGLPRRPLHRLRVEPDRRPRHQRQQRHLRRPRRGRGGGARLERAGPRLQSALVARRQVPRLSRTDDRRRRRRRGPPLRGPGPGARRTPGLRRGTRPDRIPGSGGRRRGLRAGRIALPRLVAGRPPPLRLPRRPGPPARVRHRRAHGEGDLASRRRPDGRVPHPVRRWIAPDLRPLRPDAPERRPGRGTRRVGNPPAGLR